MSHPLLTNLPPPSLPTQTFLVHLELSSPQSPKQRLSEQWHVLPRAAVG